MNEKISMNLGALAEGLDEMLGAEEKNVGVIREYVREIEKQLT